ncbi:hypothetical protein PMSM_24070 [Paenibacillus macquariensis subsp. macquariensis]|uniref:Uncharacterized protein n=1 Tax=Paenibacillus macquariensis TaxID=948756 RepID=A0ABY1KCQ3_9BACL|nr:hypothetical protein PMSM_24070 [Paenibacillus macquariensis subsp. macquariensis]SIR61538.1 hypothetical protein SAMN05421578_12322 [Paenibacillus macquariensis]
MVLMNEKAEVIMYSFLFISQKRLFPFSNEGLDVSNWDQYRVFLKETSTGGVHHAGNYYFGLYKLQAKKLRYHEEQAEQPRPHGDEEVLQVLQRANSSSRNQIRIVLLEV